jgi:GNAT superfamily N-acetyltransferase
LGFSHVNKEGPVQLEVEKADLSVFASESESRTRDIVFTTLANEQESSPDCLEKFYALYQTVEKDVPEYRPENQTSFEQCMQELQLSSVVPQSVFIAKHNGVYVGLSILGQRISEADVRFAGGPGCLSQHLTGVRADYRRKGIALALKLRTIEYAQKHGYNRILSNSDNPAMRALNWKLGFRTGPWFIYNKHLDQGEAV